jgi:cathepsin L
MKPFATLARPAARGLLLAGIALAASGLVAQEKAAPKTTQAQRDKILALDAELREAFARETRGKLPEARRKLPSAAAASFDWVKQLGLTPVHKQSGKPNCVAQATVAALEWSWQIRNGGRTKPILSPQPVLDRLGKSGALRYTEALDQLLLHGTTTLAAYPYRGEPQPPRRKAATPYRIVGWGTAGPRGKTSVEQIKQALLEHGPLVAGVYITPAFKAYRGGVFAEHFRNIPRDDPTNHAVLILGWDDRRGKGCWHVQNSWGLTWGEGGGMWIEYGCNNIGYFAYWLRAQSAQYNLPADAHKLLGDAAPLHRWPAARDVAAESPE